MSPSNFPLRWESTGDKWWYASPIDFAAANGHYDLVRELLRLDGNHLIKLTSLRRIRRLEAVWDDEAQFDDVARCRCEVAHQLFDECHQRTKQGKFKNSLIVSGYGGWLLYTAASAGDLGFVQKLLGENPLLVFGEGEYGLTDILYAAAKSKNAEVFKVVYDFAVSPRFLNGVGEMEKQMEEVPESYKIDVKNRAVHAVARGGNLVVLKELLEGCNDVLGFRDVGCSTVLHSAAGKGQVEVVKHMIASYGMTSSVDDKGNTPLHVAAYRGQLSVLEALIQASPSSASAVNKDGNTFLHMAVAGFLTPGFRRLDQQIELMKQLVSRKGFIIEDIVNCTNNEGRTALHLAIIGNIHSDLVQLLMSARYIKVNTRDDHGLTPLDYLKRQPKSASSEILIRQLISAGGISSCKDYAVRKAFASHLKMQGICSSPGTSFRQSDSEIFQGTGIDCLVHSSLDHVTEHIHFHSSSAVSQGSSTNEVECKTPDTKKSGPLHNAAKRLKTMFHWSSLGKRKETVVSNRAVEKGESFSDRKCSKLEDTPIPLRERYSNASSISSNKRSLAARSNISSPVNRKKLASEVAQDALQDQLLANLSAQPSPFTKSSLSPNSSLEKGKEICIEDDNPRPTCSKQIIFDDAPKETQKQGSMNKKFGNPILCFSGSHLSVRNSVSKHFTKQQPIQLVA